jgi:L-ectoine synthase
MIIREKDSVDIVDWGNGRSHRLLIAADGVGFAVAHTVVRAGSESRLQYRNHIEACYCISGEGEVVSADGEVRSKLVPGVLYALDRHDAHILRAAEHGDMELISVFNPPIRGDERHRLDPDGFSAY